MMSSELMIFPLFNEKLIHRVVGVLTIVLTVYWVFSVDLHNNATILYNNTTILHNGGISLPVFPEIMSGNVY